MGAFNINITGVGGHGCERKAKAGDKLYGRCGRFTCPDCMAYEFVQRMKQAGMVREGDGAYSVEVTPDDPLVEEYRTALSDHGRLTAEAEADPLHKNPPAKFSDAFYKGPIFQVDGKLWRMIPHSALFTHWPSTPTQVVDDMLTNERKEGHF